MALFENLSYISTCINSDRDQEMDSLSGCTTVWFQVQVKHSAINSYVFSDNNQSRAGIIENFNSTSRYLDNLLNNDNPFLEQIVGQIYPTELQINKENFSSILKRPF